MAMPLKRCVMPFRVVGVALRDIVTFLIRCRKSFCVTGDIFRRRFVLFVAGAAL